MVTQTQSTQAQSTQTQSNQTQSNQTQIVKTQAAQTQPKPSAPVVYPDSDGQPMSDNTKQFRWIVTVEQNLELLFADNPEVFVAGNLLWYPVEGNNKIRVGPDAMVAFGRPKGDRGSYMQWKEDNIAPQVVFEILSPGNTHREMAKKLLFYNNYGVEEYYLYDPDDHELEGWLRSPGHGLEEIDDMNSWVSPRLEIRFEMGETELELYRPDGVRFFDLAELDSQVRQEKQRVEQEKQRAEQEKQRAEQEKQRAEQEKQRAEQEKQRAEQEKQRAEQEKQRADDMAALLQQYRDRFGELG